MGLELRGITKRFPGVLANDDVSLSVELGEIVALLGENGAGKTTLMNILYGLYTPDAGEVLVDGQQLQLSSSADSIAAGIGMVHQHFMLVPVFTVTENVILGIEPTRIAGWLDMKAGSQIVENISARYKLDVDPDALVEDLPVGIQQRVEIIKVLSREARYLVFDEPTAVLTPQEVDEFFQIIDYVADMAGNIDNVAISTDMSIGTYPDHPHDPFHPPQYPDIAAHNAAVQLVDTACRIRPASPSPAASHIFRHPPME